MNPVRLFAALVALSVTGSAVADGDLPYLATIAVERAPGSHEVFGERIVSTLHVEHATRAATALSGIDGLEVLAADERSLRVAFVERPTVRGEADARFLAHSWVVDFEEQSVKALAAGLRADLEDTPTIDDLERFVYDHIVDKSYSRAFDLASQVATTGTGDCTEHAVLLAALARTNGHPARVVLGNLILDSESGLYAFGHAWTEIHDGESWTIRDATRPAMAPDVRQLRYLPMAILDDEGPGYFMSLLNTMTAMPFRISGVGNSP